MSWTPYQIEIVLHHHCSTGPFPRSTAPAYNHTASDLVNDGILIDRADGVFETTDLGKALVEMWCAQPIPVASFIDPRFERRTN